MRRGRVASCAPGPERCAPVTRELSAQEELARDGALVPGRARTMRLDRDASESNGGWDDAARGDVLDIAPAPDAARPRVGKDSAVETVVLRGD